MCVESLLLPPRGQGGEAKKTKRIPYQAWVEQGFQRGRAATLVHCGEPAPTIDVLVDHKEAYHRPHEARLDARHSEHIPHNLFQPREKRFHEKNPPRVHKTLYDR
jgi:hypothetical protein